MSTKFPCYDELWLQWAWKNDPSRCLPSTLVASKEQFQWVPPAAAATGACWNSHLKLQEHCSDCQELLTLVIFLHKWHSTVPNTPSMAKMLQTHAPGPRMWLWGEMQTLLYIKYSELLLQEKRGFKNLPGFSPLFLTALLGNCSVQRGRDFHWKPRDIPTIPSLLNPSYWSQVQSRTLKPFNPTVRCPQFLVCPGVTAWGGSGCSGVSGGGSAFLVCAPGSHSSGNARSRRWFPRSVSCVSKNHLITWMKTNTILNSECLMLRATINAIN